MVFSVWFQAQCYAANVCMKGIMVRSANRVADHYPKRAWSGPTVTGALAEDRLV